MDNPNAHMSKRSESPHKTSPHKNDHIGCFLTSGIADAFAREPLGATDKIYARMEEEADWCKKNSSDVVLSSELEHVNLKEDFKNVAQSVNVNLRVD